MYKYQRVIFLTKELHTTSKKLIKIG